MLQSKENYKTTYAYSATSLRQVEWHTHAMNFNNLRSKQGENKSLVPWTVDEEISTATRKFGIQTWATWIFNQMLNQVS